MSGTLLSVTIAVTGGLAAALVVCLWIAWVSGVGRE